jgi:hypothetical protein
VVSNLGNGSYYVAMFNLNAFPCWNDDKAEKHNLVGDFLPRRNYCVAISPTAQMLDIVLCKRREEQPWQSFR